MHARRWTNWLPTARPGIQCNKTLPSPECPGQAMPCPQNHCKRMIYSKLPLWVGPVPALGSRIAEIILSEGYCLCGVSQVLPAWVFSGLSGFHKSIGYFDVMITLTWTSADSFIYDGSHHYHSQNMSLEIKHKLLVLTVKRCVKPSTGSHSMEKKDLRQTQTNYRRWICTRRRW